MRSQRVWSFVALLVVSASRGEVPKPRTLTLTVSETAGLRRFGYPVQARLPINDRSITKEQVRLVEAGKPVPAQFRPVHSPHGETGARNEVALDFNINLDPFEKKTYTVEYGAGVKAAPEPKGLTVEETEEAITVRSGDLVYVVRRNLKGLLDEVRSGKTSYLRPGSAGLLLDGQPVLEDDRSKVQVVRHGPLAVVLRSSRLEKRAKPARHLVVTMTFPRSKSWVEVEVNTRDRDAPVTSLGASLNLEVEGKPTLVDFGAGSMVYKALGPGEAASLTARAKKSPAWEVRTGKLPRLVPFALPGTSGVQVPAEGWAHLMDSKRCTALAIDRFGRAESEDRILAEANGKLTWSRSVAGGASLRFWLHFVPMPVQLGAVTSPQSMMAPLQVEVR